MLQGKEDGCGGVGSSGLSFGGRCRRGVVSVYVSVMAEGCGALAAHMSSHVSWLDFSSCISDISEGIGALAAH